MSDSLHSRWSRIGKIGLTSFCKLPLRHDFPSTCRDHESRRKTGKTQWPDRFHLSRRSKILRPIKESEIKQTTVLSLSIEEASAKIRDEGPVDDEEDYSLPIWAGTIPVQMQLMKPNPDPRNIEGIDEPEYIQNLSLGKYQQLD